MAKIITSQYSIKNGSIVTVSNENRKKFSNQLYSYSAIWLQDFDGNNDRCYLFTGKQIINIIKRIAFTTLDLVNGRLNVLQYKNGNRYLVKLLDTKDNPIYAIITQKQLKRAKQRADRNPEDCTKKSFFRSIIE